MKSRSTPFGILAATLFLLLCALPATPQPPNPNPQPYLYYTAARAAADEYMRTSVILTDFQVFWQPTRPDLGLPPVHVASGRVINNGNRPVIIPSVTLTFLGPDNTLLDTLPALLYQTGAPMNPVIPPGGQATFYQTLPPTSGPPPANWTGQVKAEITTILLNDFTMPK